MPSKWISHVKSVYQKGKSGGMTYSQAMVAAKKTYTKKGKAKAGAEAPAPKKKRRRRKKKAPQ